MPSDTVSIQTITEIPARTVSDGEGDLKKDQIGFDQFPEGGTAAWCAIVGG